MAASIVQGAIGDVGPASSQNLPFFSPVTAGNLIAVLFFTVDNGVSGVSRIQFNAQDAATPFLDESIGSTIVQMWWAVGGEKYVTVTPVAPPVTEWSVAIFEVGGEAHLPPYELNANTGIAGTPSTLGSWVAEDTGLVIGTVVAEEATSIAEPAGWLLLGALTGTGLSVGLATRAVTAGSQASEDWDAGVGGGVSWETTTIPFYDVALRLGPAYAYGSGPGGQHPQSGHTPNPGSTVPFTSEANPLPPNPTDIEVPLPPWIPNSGTWRDDI